MSESSSGDSSVRKEIAIVAGPRNWGDTRESWLARVPRRVQTVSFRIVKSLWYGEITDSHHWAARDIRRAATIILARREASQLADQYEEIIGDRSESVDSPEIAALLSAVRALRGVARS